MACGGTNPLGLPLGVLMHCDSARMSAGTQGLSVPVVLYVHGLGEVPGGDKGRESEGKKGQGSRGIGDIAGSSTVADVKERFLKSCRTLHRKLAFC